MKNRKFFGISCLVITLAGVAGFGWAAGRCNLVESGAALLETVSCGDEYLQITKTFVYQNDGKLVIKGRAKGHKPLPKSYYAHVDVAVADSDGRIIKEGSAKLDLFPIPRWRGQEGPFSITFHNFDAANTRIFVAYHPVSASGRDHRNAAAIAAMKLINGS